jgi:hypothetical protein
VYQIIGVQLEIPMIESDVKSPSETYSSELYELAMFVLITIKEEKKTQRRTTQIERKELRKMTPISPTKRHYQEKWAFFFFFFNLFLGYIQHTKFLSKSVGYVPASEASHSFTWLST